MAFRAVYYIAPLVLAAATLAVREVLGTVPVARLLFEAGVRWTIALAPQVLAVLTFAAGSILLLSGATPSLESYYKAKLGEKDMQFCIDYAKLLEKYS